MSLKKLLYHPLIIRYCLALQNLQLHKMKYGMMNCDQLCIVSRMFEPPLYRHPPLQCMVNTIKLIYVIICTCSKILAHVIYIDKYYKAYIRRHIFYLAIFLTIFTLSPFLFNYNKILLIRLKLIFKKIHALTLRRYFKKYTV